MNVECLKLIIYRGNSKCMLFKIWKRTQFVKILFKACNIQWVMKYKVSISLASIIITVDVFMLLEQHRTTQDRFHYYTSK